MKDKFFSKIMKALKDGEEETAEDIDRQLEAEVTRIKSTAVSTLSAEDVLGGGYGEAGDFVYIMDLAPMFDMIGGSTGRLAANLVDTCEVVFMRHLGPKGGRSFVQANRFIMRFAGAKDDEGWQRSATIINDIGNRILGERFESMEVPELMVMAKVADISYGDGKLDTDKLDTVPVRL